MVVVYTSYVCLCRLGLGLETFPSFSGGCYVDGERVPVVVHWWEEYSDSIIYRRRLSALTGDVFTRILSLQGGFPWRLKASLAPMQACILVLPLWDCCLWDCVACWPELADNVTGVCFR
ncbi:hypothetical protein SETIT_5G067200v2 [Setaria italica]|uniref:Uncharacterized protein n=1 Tax=Setaria italica TaxID=4555 RepID=A0A368R1Y5_SETIT|nr:hypothetical protein SETIT_5G067200v2 [Setaria italica]